jgi:hypothetical protein
MRFSSLILSASAASAAPFTFPLANGFPTLNATSLAAVYKLAGGTLPNGALPTSLTPAGTQALQLIAANEIFEVAYFSELLANVTNSVPGDGYNVADKDYVVDTLTAIVNVRSSILIVQNTITDFSTIARTSPCPGGEWCARQREASHHPTLPI